MDAEMGGSATPGRMGRPPLNKTSPMTSEQLQERRRMLNRLSYEKMKEQSKTQHISDQRSDAQKKDGNMSGQKKRQKQKTTSNTVFSTSAPCCQSLFKTSAGFYKPSSLTPLVVAL